MRSRRGAARGRTAPRSRARADSGGSGTCLPPGSFGGERLGFVVVHHLAIQLGDLAPQRAQEHVPGGGDAIQLATTRVAAGLAPLQPAIALHARERGVQRSRTEPVAMLLELLEQPRAPDIPRRRVMENVDLPDPQPDLAVLGR